LPHFGLLSYASGTGRIGFRAHYPTSGRFRALWRMRGAHGRARTSSRPALFFASSPMRRVERLAPVRACTRAWRGSSGRLDRPRQAPQPRRAHPYPSARLTRPPSPDTTPINPGQRPAPHLTTPTSFIQTRSGRAGGDCCSSTKPAASGERLDPRLTAPSDDERERRSRLLLLDGTSPAVCGD